MMIVTVLGRIAGVFGFVGRAGLGSLRRATRLAALIAGVGRRATVHVGVACVQFSQCVSVPREELFGQGHERRPMVLVVSFWRARVDVVILRQVEVVDDAHLLLGKSHGELPSERWRRDRRWPVGARLDAWVVELVAVSATEPRGVVGFEGVLGALLAAVDGGVLTSIHGVVEQRHGLF